MKNSSAFGTKKFVAVAILFFQRLVPRLFVGLSKARHQAFLMFKNEHVAWHDKFSQPVFTTCTNPIIHLFNPPKICIGIVFDYP